MNINSFPPWLASRVPPSLSGNIVAAALPTQTFKQGKRRIKKTKNDDRKVITKNFIEQLNSALACRARELEVIDAATAIPTPLANLISDFYKLVIQASDGISSHRGKAPPRTLKIVEGLTQPLQKFQASAHGGMPASTPSSATYAILDELIADVAHFIQQIEMTQASVILVGGAPRMRNRPIKRDAKAALEKIVIAYQKRHGTGEFPKNGVTLAQLKARGYVISARTLRDWRGQMTNNTFGHFAQSKKRQ